MKESVVLLDSIKHLASELQDKLYLIGLEIESNLLKIKDSNSFDASNEYFDRVQYIQQVLSELIFNSKISAPNFLNNFVMEFDRIDDTEVRRHFFREIQGGRYRFQRG